MMSFNAPSRYAYAGLPVAAGDWQDATQWDNLDFGAHAVRKIPGMPGDSVDVPAANHLYDVTLRVAGSPALKTLTFGPASATSDGGMLRFANTNAAPAALVFDSAAPGVAATILPRFGQHLIFGRDARQDNLSIQMNSPLLLRKDMNRALYTHFNCPLTGGAPGTQLEFYNNANAELHVLLSVTNSFTGDILLNRRSGAGETTLYAGWSWSLFGPAVAAHDGMFGAPGNRVILRGDPLLWINSIGGGTSFTFNRALLGNGRMRRLVQTTGFGNNGANPLVLGENAVISPGEGNTLGKLEILSTSLDTHPDATFRIKLTKKASDTVYLDCRAAVNLTCRLEIIELDNAIRTGDTWVIMTAPVPVAPSFFGVTSLNVNFNRRTPGYQTHVVQGSDNIWRVHLTRHALGSLLMVR